MHDQRGLALGFASHALAGVSPFIVAATISRVGLMPATALIYIGGAAWLALLVLVLPAVRATLVRETRLLWGPAFRWRFAGALAGFLVAGVAYYQGLSRSGRVAEYVFLTRLDWLIQAPVAILLLKEPWTRGGLLGGALALGGGVMLAWTGTIGASGFAAASLYIGASLMGYLCATPITAARALAGAGALTVWRHGINAVGFVLLAVPAWPQANGPLDRSTILLVAVGAIVIVALFLLRFAALTRIPLWVLSAQAPVQAAVAVTASWLTEGRLPMTTLAAIGMVVCGEYVVATRRPHARSHAGGR